MALLQISEPGMSTAPHQHRLAVGIDLGTTNSLVATVRNGVPQCLQDDDGKLLLPSVVHYLPDGQIVVGRKAQATQATDPHYHQHLGEALHGPRPQGRRPRRHHALRLR